MATSSRGHRLLWVIDYANMPKQAEGYDCGPGNEGYCWFPDLGFSGPCFETEMECYVEAIAKCEKRIADEQRLLGKLRGLVPA